MDKVSFIIPNNKINNLINKPVESVNIKNTDKSEIISENKKQNITNEIIDTTNITDYIKISPNVYRFGKPTFNLEDNIYILYNNACQVKQENKYTAIEMFKSCYKLINDKTNKEIRYQICINLALLYSELDSDCEVIFNYYEEALKIFSDRAEPYYYCSIYCNKIHNFEKSYNLLKNALLLSYDDAKKKYPEVQLTAYGKYLYDELSVSCYWLKKYDEAKLLLEIIINDPDFNDSRERINKNLELVKKELEGL